MIAVVRVQPIIATLGTFLAYQGITLEMLPMAGGMAPDGCAGLPKPMPAFRASFLLPVIVRARLAALEKDGLSPQPARRRRRSARAAYASGVNVIGVRILAYVIGGVLAAVAGLVFTAALASGDPRVGVPYTLTSIAAVALGGVALSGGRGGMLGARPPVRCCF